MENNPATIRELVKIKSELLRNPSELDLKTANLQLVELSSLKSIINKECSDRLYWYNILKQNLRQKHKSVAGVRLEAEASKEWRDWKEADDLRDAVIEMERSLKYFIRNLEQEFKESVY